MPAPEHDPTKDPKGATPYLYTDQEQQQWMWDFTKSSWFLYQEEDDPSSVAPPPSAPIYRKEDFDDDVEPPKKKQKVVAPPKDTRPSSIYVENLPSDTTVEEIVSFFSKTGIIKRDEYTGEYKVKMYTDEEGSFKGDALVTYFLPDSVPLAITVLDGADFRFKVSIKVTEAKFSNDASSNKRKNKKKGSYKKPKIRFDQSKDLSWEEEKRVHVVLKGMFDPKDAWTDLDFAKDLKEDVKEEAERFGKVDLVAVFENNPEGVVTIKFQDPVAAAACLEAMDGRYFAKRKISAQYYDGFTNYKVKESDEQRKLREEAWTKFIGGEEEDSEE